MFSTDSNEIELLYLFGGRRLLIIVGIVLYLIAGAALLMFIPQTYDWVRAEARYTVQADIVSSKVDYFGSSRKKEDKRYEVTMEYEINGIRRTHTEICSHEPTGKQKLRVYCTRDGRWEVLEYNIPAMIFLTAIAVCAAIYGTTVLRAAKERKNTGESA